MEGSRAAMIGYITWYSLFPAPKRLSKSPGLEDRYLIRFVYRNDDILFAVF